MTNGIRIVGCLSKEKMSAETTMDYEEEYFDDLHSPTDNSEDSVEVKISAISSISSRNKRKCSEPRKMPEKFTGPLKKRMCLKIQSEKLGENQPFRPWSPPVKLKEEIKKEANETVNEAINYEKVPNKIRVKLETEDKKIEPKFVIPPFPLVPPFPLNSALLGQFPVMPTSYFRPPSPAKFHDEPVPLIKKCQKKIDEVIKQEPSSSQSDVRVPIHPQVSTLSQAETERLITKSTELFPGLKKNEESNAGSSCSSSRREQRNYKNMTRERRIEANARERTRVHTISAAFDTLRKAIPSYSHNQKLSKLSVLRIACSYIMTLSNIVQDDDKNKTAEGVDLITKTIQREGKLRKKKDDND